MISISPHTTLMPVELMVIMKLLFLLLTTVTILASLAIASPVEYTISINIATSTTTYRR
jgi:hypothetical protein